MTITSTVIVALTLYREASNCSHDARVGILCSMQNRIRINPREWGNNLLEVCLKPMQYSSMTAPGDPNEKRWMQGEADPVWLDCLSIVMNQNPKADITSGATHYFTLPCTRVPDEWGKEAEEVICIDGIHFVKGVK